MMCVCLLFILRRVKELSSTSGQVNKLEKAKNEIEQTVLHLETK